MNIRFNIRVYQKKDKNQVINIWKKCNLIIPQNDPELDIKSKVIFQPNLFFVGLLNTKIIGTIMAGYEGHRGWINYLAVDTKYQRKGYGSKLMKKATDELIKLGCQKINLQVRETNIRAIKFYKKLNYKDDKVITLGKRLI